MGLLSSNGLDLVWQIGIMTIMEQFRSHIDSGLKQVIMQTYQTSMFHCLVIVKLNQWLFLWIFSIILAWKPDSNKVGEKL